MTLPDRWNVDWGVKVLDPKFATLASASADTAIPFKALSDATANAASAFKDLGKSFAGMKITVNKNLSPDQFAIKHNNEAIVSPEMFERLQQQVQKRMDDQMVDLLRGAPKTPDPMMVAEQEQMENTELWGAF